MLMALIVVLPLDKAITSALPISVSLTSAMFESEEDQETPLYPLSSVVGL